MRVCVGTTAMHGFGILVLILPLCLSAPANVRTVVVTAPVEIVTVTQVGTQIYSATSLETSRAKTTSLESRLESTSAKTTSLESVYQPVYPPVRPAVCLPLATHTIIPCLKSGKGFGRRKVE